MTDFFDNKVLRKSLRQQILEQRRQVTPVKAYEAGVEIVKILSHHKHFLQKKMVGSYLSLGGELSTEPINEYLLEHHELALPFMDVHVKGHMDFYSYKKGDRLIENRFHILEPENLPENLVTPDKFEALIVPLVGFDNKGNRLGMGGGYYDRMLKKLLGTDGAASNNRLDIWGEMRCAALLHKGIRRDPMALSACDALRMATFEGASALGFKKKGLLKEGWVADLVLVDLDQPHYIGIGTENAAPFLVYAGSSADVYATMVNGAWVYRDRVFPGMDSEKILAKAGEMRTDLLGR